MAKYPFMAEGETVDTSGIGFPTFTHNTVGKRVVTADIWAYLHLGWPHSQYRSLS